ncbi:hypothetical protein QZG57_09360 [Corynebacterium glucuronolyticum]|uniref:hypothetical protein n=1 Tax=Corynebacterium glucuronolyticum TaxID=39791 RepID=UPI00223C0319|nr:hypothetical protein [Corynebacterium glucuronolyticum]MCT1442989.1 hypothetical protein [Corynebacterium glucuronolyticum]
MRLAPIDPENFHTLPVYARLSTYWELAPDVSDLTSGQREFEKEAWVATAESCGFTFGPAAIFYCHPSLAPGAVRLDAGPVSGDAQLATSMFVDPGFTGIGIEPVLMDSVIMEVTLGGSPALEAFGAHEEPTEEQAVAGFFSGEFLESSGFSLLRRGSEADLYRLELPPRDRVLSIAALADMVAAI